MIWTDFHSHILPGIDDGAPNPETSLEMLRLAASQGVGQIVATPHYRFTDEPPSEFAKRRLAAAERIAAIAEPNLPEIILGCEIMLSAHVNENDLTPLIISEYNAMLFEFPMTGFRNWMIDEIENISLQYKITPIIAHFERYDPLSSEHMEALTSINGIVFQFNNTALKFRYAIGQMNSLLDIGIPVILSSDAHGTAHRSYSFDIPNKILNGHSITDISARKLLKRIMDTPAPFFTK